MPGQPKNQPDDKSTHETNPYAQDVDPQMFERSMDFWVTGKEDYPPAIRGVIADLDDLPTELHGMIQKIASDSDFPDLQLKRLLWFEDKNDKLDEACVESREVFRPFVVDADGLIVATAQNNPCVEKPSRHRLVVTDQFAQTNYDRVDSMPWALNKPEKSSEPISEKSWKRKISQTLKPWTVRRGSRLERVRPPCDLMLTLNELLSRTKHGWLVVDLIKLRRRRGAMLTYASTFEYQRRNDHVFEFKLELIGVADELKRYQPCLSHIGCLFVEIDEHGNAYIPKASILPGVDKKPSGDTAGTVSQQKGSQAIPVLAKIVFSPGKPSQLIISKSSNFYAKMIKPLIKTGERTLHKLDLRKPDTAGKRFDLKILMDLPLLIASSGDGLIFSLNEMLERFSETNLAKLRAAHQQT